MKQSQKLAVRSSEIRSRLAEISEIPEGEFTDELRAEEKKLTDEFQNTESRLRAALIAEGADIDGAKKQFETDPKLTELEDRCSVGKIFEAVIEQRATEGPEAELQKELGLSSNQIPLALIRGPRTPAGNVETRAVTPAPANVGQNQDMIIPAVFPMSAGEFLGVDMPTVPVGDAVYPVLTNNAAANDADESAEVGETTGAFTAEVLQPRRIQASFFYTREDRARFAGMDAALRMNLSDALSSGFDNYILNKTGEGLLDFGTDPTASSNEETFASYRAALFGEVDGRYAMTAMDVCALVGSATYAHMASKYRGNTADDSALDSLMRVSGGVRVSGHVPAVDTMIQQAVFARGKQHRHAIGPVWEGVEMIPDFVTRAKSGEIVITAVMLVSFKVVRADGYKRFGFKVEA